ncbi:hypothetical protein [Streptosporangium sp. NPDC002607]
MIQITAHLHQDDNGAAHVAIYATDPGHTPSSEPSPFPCGVLTMSPAAGAELVARVQAGESEQTITPEQAAHVLWHFDATGGMEPGSFTQALITTIASADRTNMLRMAAIYPGYVGAVHLAQNTADGVRLLQGLARQMLVPAPQDGGEHRG